LEYAKNWAGENGKVMIVKIDPKDVVSVPEREACKCRVSRYEVIQEIKQEIESPVVSVENGEVKENEREWDKFVNKIANYLDKKWNQAGELGVIDEASVSIKQIQNSFSPDYPSRTKVLAALQELGEKVENERVFLS
jgi:predicted RNase H-like nuclease